MYQKNYSLFHLFEDIVSQKVNMRKKKFTLSVDMARITWYTLGELEGGDRNVLFDQERTEAKRASWKDAPASRCISNWN